MEGHNIIAETIHDLIAKYQLDAAPELILSGCSGATRLPSPPRACDFITTGRQRDRGDTHNRAVAV